MPVTPTGPLSLMLSRAAEILAASPSFRAVVGAGNESQALAKIHYPCVNWERDRDDTTPLPTRPLAIISRVYGDEFRIDNRGARDGTLTFSFEFPVSTSFLASGDADSLVLADAQGAELQYLNDVGAILLDLINLSNAVKAGGGNYGRIVDIDMSVPPMLAELDIENGGPQLFFTSAWIVRFN